MKEVKIICENFVLMDLSNILVFSGDVMRDINMENPHLFTFGNTKLQYMSATIQIAAKENWLFYKFKLYVERKCSKKVQSLIDGMS